MSIQSSATKFWYIPYIAAKSITLPIAKTIILIFIVFILLLNMYYIF